MKTSFVQDLDLGQGGLVFGEQDVLLVLEVLDLDLVFLAFADVEVVRGQLLREVFDFLVLRLDRVVGPVDLFVGD